MSLGSKTGPRATRPAKPWSPRRGAYRLAVAAAGRTGEPEPKAGFSKGVCLAYGQEAILEVLLCQRDGGGAEQESKTSPEAGGICGKATASCGTASGGGSFRASRRNLFPW
ncbi:hypothetical protein MPNT_50124 [Candidatus Methylacidithermus pantelleriae]|uniref:Uncharacterized protein n=1 Tax=Candidatus Methylacidithermus pantelleriae TaxID=2744239 RepID=A0A8J2BQ34_9BACT|nr:hypothetical protein MPNT_50124 [Candidatus Methylacidithermus pantelleriae]